MLPVYGHLVHDATYPERGDDRRGSSGAHDLEPANHKAVQSTVAPVNGYRFPNGHMARGACQVRDRAGVAA